MFDALWKFATHCVEHPLALLGAGKFAFASFHCSLFIANFSPAHSLFIPLPLCTLALLGADDDGKPASGGLQHAFEPGMHVIHDGSVAQLPAEGVRVWQALPSPGTWYSARRKRQGSRPKVPADLHDPVPLQVRDKVTASQHIDSDTGRSRRSCTAGPTTRKHGGRWRIATPSRVVWRALPADDRAWRGSGAVFGATR